MKNANQCILFATADWDEKYWTNKQHCALSLSKKNFQVLYVESVGLRTPNLNSKRDMLRLMRRFIKGISCLLLGPKERSPNIFVLSPLMIPFARKFFLVKYINKFLLILLLFRSNIKLKFQNPIMWSYHPYINDLYRFINPSKILYHCVDDLAAMPGVDTSSYKSEEEILLKEANVVFCTSSKLHRSCREKNMNSYYFSNVVDIDHFIKSDKNKEVPADIVSIEEPRICYHGVLSDFKIDFELVYNLARNRRDLNFIFIGEEREGQHSNLVKLLKLEPNVHFLGYKPYDLLPTYLNNMQLGILPSVINEYTDSMYPMKYFEYIASGLRVVSTPLEFTALSNAGLLVGDDERSLSCAINQQLERGRLGNEEIRKIVGDNTYADRTERMLTHLMKV